MLFLKTDFHFLDVSWGLGALTRFHVQIGEVRRSRICDGRGGGVPVLRRRVVVEHY